MTRPSYDDIKDFERGPVGLTLQDMTWIFCAMIFGVTACAILGLSLLRADRPAVCRAYDLRGAECSAAVAEAL